VALQRLGHFAHVPPPLPQRSFVLPGAQTPLIQHPAHEFVVHAHLPDTHSWPKPHGALIPHRHTPPAHWSVVRGSHAAPCPHAQ
jgi:hypothetical protein